MAFPMAKSKYTAADRAKMTALVKAGKSIRQAAAELGVSPAAVWQACKAAGLDFTSMGRECHAVRTASGPALPEPLGGRDYRPPGASLLTPKRLAEIQAEMAEMYTPTPPPTKAEVRARIRNCLRSWPPVHGRRLDD